MTKTCGEESLIAVESSTLRRLYTIPCELAFQPFVALLSERRNNRIFKAEVYRRVMLAFWNSEPKREHSFVSKSSNRSCEQGENGKFRDVHTNDLDCASAEFPFLNVSHFLDNLKTAVHLRYIRPCKLIGFLDHVDVGVAVNWPLSIKVELEHSMQKWCSQVMIAIVLDKPINGNEQT